MKHVLMKKDWSELEDHEKALFNGYEGWKKGQLLTDNNVFKEHELGRLIKHRARCKKHYWKDK